ncbi:GntR family transcriptional regulator [Aeromicrobium tamlense]|uniref:GntR family transcriptional regulator n=1 Tax=Aeromicrobium tamlense TaxID=375541 RepID=A0A8I0FUH2_9ACTN|nr:MULTISPECIES: GntR family transcriptional regulator [Aeromicrobium]MBD1269923.1 GntR family transcriptional regulator [Aeromicrobium tamlense]NYI39420.1 DNA-binding GntR family transcriptional regulator [Aeromicrobium tamlense]
MAKTTPTATGVQRCLTEIRQMIISGTLLPGQKVHQGEIAAQLNVSRIPVREALSTLQAEGVLDYKPNTGFTVARFSGEDLAEIYLMRRLLETEVVRTVDLAAVDVDELKRLNDHLKTLSANTDPDEWQSTNFDFHFLIFEPSPLKLVREEIRRLWYMSSFYRSLYIQQADSRLRVHEDHDKIIEAVKARDNEALIKLSDEHRGSTEHLLTQRLGWSRPR